MKIDMPFDAIEIARWHDSGDELVLCWQGKPMYKIPIPPLAHGSSFTVEGLRGSMECRVGQDATAEVPK